MRRLSTRNYQHRRNYCAVKGCRRYWGHDSLMKNYGHVDIDFICGFHWRRLTKAEKAVFHRIKRWHRRLDIEGSDRCHRIFANLVKRAGLPDA